MTVYLFIKEDKTIYGYHTEEVKDSVPFETDLNEEAWSEYFVSIQSAAKLVNGKIETFEVFDKMPLEIELAEIYKWFLDNDYIANKIIFEEWEKTDPRYLAYLEERQIKRQRFDELKALLGV